MTQFNRISPLLYARSAGILFLILMVCGPFSMVYVPSELIVAGDAATTVKNITASGMLFRIGMVVESIVFLCEIALTVLLFRLLKPVSETLAMIAAFSRLAMAIMQGANLLNNFAVLQLLSGADYLKGIGPDRLPAFVMFYLGRHESGVYVWQLCFGLHLLVLGCLIFRSGYLPRIFGPLTVLAAAGYLIESYGNLFFPGYREIFSIIVAGGSIIGEIPFAFWLLFKGVNIQKWETRISAVA